jgi:hypothetical protein
VIEAVARIAAELGVSSAEVALARVRNRPAITSTLIGARTLEQLRSNLASLEVTLAPAQLAALEAPSAPSLDFPAPYHAGLGPMLGFGGTTVDGVSSRSGRHCSRAQPATELTIAGDGASWVRCWRFRQAGGSTRRQRTHAS